MKANTSTVTAIQGIQEIEITKNKAEQQKDEEIQEQEEVQRIETDIQQEKRNE